MRRRDRPAAGEVVRAEAPASIPPLTPPLMPPHSLAHRWRIAALLGAALALAACGDATGPLPREGAPTELEFSIGGYGGASRIVRLHDGAVLALRTPWSWDGAPTTDTVRVVPTADAWRAFWAAAERAGVRRWRPSYMAEGIADGEGWGVRIVAGGVTIESWGANAYPDSRGREQEGSRTDEFQEFVRALGTLTGQAW